MYFSLKSDIYEDMINRYNGRKLHPNIKKSDVDTMISSDIFQVSLAMDSFIEDNFNRILSNKEMYKKVLLTLKKDFLDKIEYYDSVSNEYNRSVRKNNVFYNKIVSESIDPFEIVKSDFDKQFVDDDDDELVLCAKTLYWVNKVKNQVQEIKKKLLLDVDNKNIMKYFKNMKLKILDYDEKNRDNDEEYFSDLITEYKFACDDYYSGDKEKEELDDTEEIKVIKDFSNKLEKEYGVKVSQRDIFDYFCLSDSINSLYELKAFCVEKLMELSQKEENKDDIRIYYQNDDRYQNDLNHCKDKIGLSVLIKNMNLPVNIHIDKGLINEKEKQLNINVPEGNIGINLKNTLYYKYSNSNQKVIEELNEIRNLSYLPFDLQEFVKNAYSMCNNLDEVVILTKKNLNDKNIKSL